jgi:hypothetical protein
MNRYDISLNKKPKKKNIQLFGKGKKKVESSQSGTQSDPDSQFTAEISNVGSSNNVFSLSGGVAGVRRLGLVSGETFSRGVPGILGNGDEDSSDIHVSGNTLYRGTPSTNLHIRPHSNALVHQGNNIYSTEGPTSQHVVIAGPDGHRTAIPLRFLSYSITNNGDNTSNVLFVLPTSEAEILEDDIRRGLRRVARNNNG